MLHIRLFDKSPKTVKKLCKMGKKILDFLHQPVVQ